MKKEKTPEEIEQHEEEKRFNRRYAGFKRSLKSLCSEEGLRSVELKLEFLRANPKTILLKEYFTHKQTVSCYAEAIAEYKEALELA